MPTAAKLAAAVLFAALAWVVSGLLIPYVFEEGQGVGRFREINAAISAIVGWRVAGSRAGTSWAGAIGYGLTAAAASVLSLLFLQSFAVMIRQSIRRMYDGPMEAVVDVFGIMAQNGAVLGHQDVLVTLVVGAILAGLVTEWFGRNFR